ncbi:13248_t:CDS:2, partial [Acaulospora colombiana]
MEIETAKPKNPKPSNASDELKVLPPSFTVFLEMALPYYPVNNISGRFNIALSFAFGTMFALYFAAPISGGHTAPNFTLAFASFRKFPWKLAGAFIATGIAYLSYYSTIHHLNANTDGSIEFAALYLTRPNSYVNTGYKI